MQIQQIVDLTATVLKSLEEQMHPSATILPCFPRSIQLDGYSCGAKSTYTILRYYRISCTTKSVERTLKTTYNGTSVKNILRVLRQKGLSCKEVDKAKLSQIREAIDNGSPVLISVFDGWHYSVVYGYSDSHIFVMNPSLDVTDMGSVWNAVPRRRFADIWDHWGIIVGNA